MVLVIIVMIKNHEFLPNFVLVPACSTPAYNRSPIQTPGILIGDTTRSFSFFFFSFCLSIKALSKLIGGTSQ